MNKIRFFTLLIGLLVGANMQAQVRYLKAIGGTGDEEARKMIQAPDGDYVVVGYVNSSTVNHGANAFRDALIFKMSPEGILRWAWAIGGNKEEEFRDIVAYQGYYYCVGYTNTYVKNGTALNEKDILLVKLEMDGDVVWAKHFGEPTTTALFNDIGVAIEVTPSSGVMVAGTTGAGSANESDLVVINVRPDATVGFAKKYDTVDIGGLSPDNTYDITSDGGGNYYVSSSIHGQTIGVSDLDGMMMKINNLGTVSWARRMRSDASAENCESSVYNAANNRVYSAGFRVTSATDSDPIVWTLRADNGTGGAAPPPRLRRYNALIQRRGMLLFPKKPSGFYGTLYGNTGDPAQLAAMDAIIFSLDEPLTSPIPWQKSLGLGAEYDYISHLASCNGSDDILAVGGTRSAWLGSGFPLNYDVMLARLTPTGSLPTSPSCVVNATYTADTLVNSNLDNYANVTTTNLTLSSNWYNNDTIKLPASINAMGYLLTRDSCTEPTGIIQTTSGLSIQKPGSGHSFESIVVEECLEANCLQNLKFNFMHPVLSSSFLIYDDLGYEYFASTSRKKLAEGINFQSLQLKPGLYRWKLDSPLDNGFIEHHYGIIEIPE